MARIPDSEIERLKSEISLERDGAEMRPVAGEGGRMAVLDVGGGEG